MRTYEEILADLSAMADEKYRAFNERIVNIPAGSSIGVRTPMLRDYGKRLVRGEGFDLDALLACPDAVFEIRLLKGFAIGAARLPFAQKAEYIDRFLPAIDHWAECDLFCSSLKEVKKHRAEFLPRIEKYVGQGTEFSQRFGYVMLLGCYMEREYLPAVFELLKGADTQYYYTHMGAAWLIAEVLVKFYDEGIAYLRACPLDARTVNKAIQKARESYRLTPQQKESLRALRR